ncbi:MAG: NAD(P)H-dependent oxidoreductase [Bacteroidota bacterium]|nr:NAD(P)H-dependent oxidoreductase [Bacteroidota bacterium]
MVLVFHPLLHKSRVNSVLIKAVGEMEGVSCRYMYDLYPDFQIDIIEEQEVLLEHDIIIWQHPFYWYSSPSLLKEWLDLVLEHGFAFGKEGRALEGKSVMSAISTGGRRDTYGSEEKVKFSVRSLLAPFEQTANLCRMRYLPPFVSHGTYLLNGQQIWKAAGEYVRIVKGLRDGTLPMEELLSKEYINDIIS